MAKQGELREGYWDTMSGRSWHAFLKDYEDQGWMLTGWESANHGNGRKAVFMKL